MSQSIEVSSETKHELDQLISDENYDALISKLLKLLPTGDDEGEYTPEFRAELLNAKLEAINGELIDHEEVQKRLER